MKEIILNHSIKLVKQYNPEFDQDKLSEVRYGIEATYMSITKVVVILLASLLLGIFKESVIILLLFNILRMPGYGLHATKSWMCWISSSIVFIGAPIMCKYLVVSKTILLIIAVVCIIHFILFAPADTYKRPLIKKKKRLFLKIATIVFGIAYIVLIIYINNQFIINALTVALMIEATLISPLTYKLFKLSYNNYKNYNG